MYVFQQLTGFGVHTDFLRDLAISNIEGIAQAATPFLLFQFLGGNFTGMGLEGNHSCLLQTDMCLLCQFLSRIGERIGSGRHYKEPQQGYYAFPGCWHDRYSSRID